jgi:hypothetical protein
MTQWKLVPVEPTQKMKATARARGVLLVDDFWADLLFDAPEAPRLTDEELFELWRKHGGDDYILEFARAIETKVRGDYTIPLYTADILAQARASALEEAAKLAENGSFLHSNAPDARFGFQLAAAIRKLKEKPNASR